MKKFFGITTLVSVIVLLLLMVSATVTGRILGQAISVDLFYASALFMTCTIVAAVSGTVWFCLNVSRKPVTAILHIGMLVIIAGALVSRYCSVNGRMHLREGETADWFASDDGMKTELPFPVTLRMFDVAYHDKSDAIRSCSSHVSIYGNQGVISMNRPFRYKGYRFYQSGFDDDRAGTFLLVGHDPVGITVVFCGYALVLVAMILFWFKSDTGFRAAIKRLKQNSIGRFNLPPMIRRITLACAWLLLFTLTWLLGLRWYVSGHVPMTDSYEMMLLIGWTSMVITTIFGRKHTFVIPLGLVLGGVSVLVAFISRPTAAEPLNPILDSPLLAFHVACMMVAYTLFGLMALCSLAGLRAFRPEARVYLADVSHMALYPALFMLVLGTILGSFWGNISWGSYWQWDPKETWALITVLVYSMAIHTGSMPKFRDNRFFNRYIVLSFITVLVTYFGVNLLLGGIHSYV